MLEASKQLWRKFACLEEGRKEKSGKEKEKRKEVGNGCEKDERAIFKICFLSPYSVNDSRSKYVICSVKF